MRMEHRALEAGLPTTLQGAFASPLKLPLAGYRCFTRLNGSTDEGYSGHYWSSTVNGNNLMALRLHAVTAD